MEEKAFKPSSIPNKKYGEVQSNQPSPVYDAPGTIYRGYSMEKTGEGFKLNLQTPIIKNLTTGTHTNTLLQYSIGYPPHGKTLYITGINLNMSIASLIGDSYFKITEKDKAIVKFQTGLLRSGIFSMNFNPPLKIESQNNPNITPSGCQVVIFTGTAGTINQLSYTISGWYE